MSVCCTAWVPLLDEHSIREPLALGSDVRAYLLNFSRVLHTWSWICVSLLWQLKDCMLQVHDIEDLVRVGKEIKACPYFAARKLAGDKA